MKKRPFSDALGSENGRLLSSLLSGRLNGRFNYKNYLLLPAIATAAIATATIATIRAILPRAGLIDAQIAIVNDLTV
jgi:hypothetical protein